MHNDNQYTDLSSPFAQYAINISLKYKYLFFETPKVACSTIKATLIQAELEDNVNFSDLDKLHIRKHSPLISINQIGNPLTFINRKDIFKFCFVRHPFSRILSVYLEKIKNNKNIRIKKQVLLSGKKNKSIDLKFLNAILNIPYLKNFKLIYQIIEKIETKIIINKPLHFKDFVHSICNQSISEMNPHWKVQYYHTCHDIIIYDFIGKFESFEQDFSRLSKLLNINIDSYLKSIISHQTNATKLINEYYTPDLKKMIYDKYKIDFVHFKYEYYEF